MFSVSHSKTLWFRSKPQSGLSKLPVFGPSFPLAPQEGTVGKRLCQLVASASSELSAEGQPALRAVWKAPRVTQGFVPVKFPLPTWDGSFCQGKLIQAP